MSEIHNTRLVRRTGIVLTAMLLAFPLAIWGTLQGLHRLNDDAISWTAPDLAARRDLAWFNEYFGSGNAILVSWPGATLTDSGLQRFAQALRDMAGDGGEASSWLQGVVTGGDVYGELTSEPLGLSDRQAFGRLQGMFVGPDGRTSCAVVALSDEAGLEARQVLDTIRQVAQQQCGVDPEQLRMVGYVVETGTLDAAALDTLYWLSIPSAVLVILIAWPCLKSFRLAMLVWTAATFCQCFSLSMVFYHSGRMNGMMTVLPILMLVIFVSSAVHMINYYHEAIDEVGPLAAPTQAVAAAWFPCSLAVVTSAIGVGSLAMSRTDPVRSFGTYAAIGAIFSLVILLLLLPGGMHLAAGRAGRAERADEKRRADRLWSKSRLWTQMAWLESRFSTPILLVCLAATVFCGFGLARMRGSMQLTDFLPESSRIAQDHRWFQENIGPLLPVEMVLRFERGSSLSMVARLELVESIERAVRAMPGPTGTVSLAAFLPKQGSTGGLRGTIQRAVFNRRLEGQRAELAADSSYLAETGEEELWRVTARLEGLTGQRYEEMLADLRQVVGPVLSDAQRQPGHGVSIIYTGMLPLLAESHSTVIRDLIVSFSVSLLLIGVVLLIGLQSVRLGLLSILPNVFPIVLVFGTLGWLGRSIDVGTMMTASVGLGIAVDGTVHYLARFMRGMQRGLSRHESILYAYEHSAAAMLRSTAICGAGLAVYGASSFLPAARFGWIITALLLTALAGDLILLPALLAGRLGDLLFLDRPASASAAVPGEGGYPAYERSQSPGSSGEAVGRSARPHQCGRCEPPPTNDPG